MYARCGWLGRAQEVFHKLPVRDCVSWTSLIGGFSEHGQCEEALEFLDQMQTDGVAPSAVTYTCSLKACGSLRSIDKGQLLHADIERKGLLEEDAFVGSSLVDMYVKCGLPDVAHAIFNKLRVHDVVLWTTLIAGFTDNGHSEEALKFFLQMKAEGFPPNDVTFICSLKACGALGALYMGQEIHFEIENSGLGLDMALGSTLIDMYAKCGLLAKAQDVFDKLPVRNIISWNALISGYAELGKGADALKLFERMQDECVSPNAATFVSCFKACGNEDMDYVFSLHSGIEKRGLLGREVVGNTLVDTYGRCGSIDMAHKVLTNLPVRDVFSWTALIARYVEHGQNEEALKCFKQMQTEDVIPNAITFDCLLCCCASSGDVIQLRVLHAEVERRGLPQGDLTLGNTLVDTYVKCGLLVLAQELHSGLLVRDTISWTSLLAGYTEHGYGNEALGHLEQMQCEGVLPNAVTYICSLKACVCVGAIEKGRQIHAGIECQGFLKENSSIGNALIFLYANCCSPFEAQQVFDRLPMQNVVSWNTLMAAYALQCHDEKVLKCYQQMKLVGVLPDAMLLLYGLRACCSMGAIKFGRDIHNELERQGLVEGDVCTNLINMYAKCGLLVKAQQILDDLSVWDVLSWTAVMAGYARLGDSQKAFSSFKMMVEHGTKPDHVTFKVLLCVCRTIGLYNKMLTYLDAMSEEHGIVPTLEHQTSLVDLLGHLGQLDEAVLMTKEMPCTSNYLVWGSVLDACKKYGNMDFGKEAFIRALTSVA